jgi:ankyrin repeat protein
VRNDDPRAIAGAAAIRTGDLAALERLLTENPDLADVQIEGRRGGYRTPLHVVADWPGYFPNGPAAVRLLLANGADPNGGAEGFGRHETPLHWAASSDDVDVAEALIDGGANVRARLWTRQAPSTLVGRRWCRGCRNAARAQPVSKSSAAGPVTRDRPSCHRSVGVDVLDDRGDSLAHADAHGGQSVAP